MITPSESNAQPKLAQTARGDIDIRLFDDTGAPIKENIEALRRVLPAMNNLEDGRKLGYKCGISPWRVLALPWNDRRMARARRKTSLGQRAPSISVTRYVVLSSTEKRLEYWYVASDGQHRAVAYREANKHRIGAELGWEAYVRPYCYVLHIVDDRLFSLWEIQDGNWTKYVTDLTHREAAVAVALGCHKV